MNTYDFKAELPNNYEQKCCCALVIDTSISMQGNPINELNEGLKAFYSDIQLDSTTLNRLEVALVEFNDSVDIRIQPSLATDFTMPHLTTKGSTRLVDGVREGIKVIRKRKEWYKSSGQPYYRPWVILITDGAPDSGQDIHGLSNEIKEGVSNKEFFFFSIGVQGADMNMLRNISDSSMVPAQLQGLKFSEFFKWLSASMNCIAHSKDGDKINLPDPSKWMVGFTI